MRSNRQPVARGVLVVFSAAAVLALAGSAFGQNYRGEAGTRLDRNQRVGGSGVNAPTANIRDRIWMNNQIITGGAPAGRSFRGYVGYTAPDEFRGVAGSNSNYDFRRDSAASSTAASGIRASDALRYQLSITTGQTVPSYMSAAVITPRDANAASSGVTTGSSAALRSTADYVSARALRPTMVGSRTDKEGREWNAAASPLTGLNWLRVGDGSATQKADAPKPEEKLSEFAVPGAEEQRRKEEERVARYTMTPTGLENYSPLMRLRQQRNEDAAANSRRPGNLAVTEDEPARTVTRVVEHDRFITSVREAYKPDRPSTEPPIDPNAKPDAIAVAEKPKSAMELELDRLSRIMRGLPPTAPKTETAGVPDGVNPFEPAPAPTPKPRRNRAKDDEKKPLSPELVAALRAAGVKNIESLAPATGTADPEWYRLQMQNGQRALSDQRYFDAEDRFTRAIAAMPNDPMAKVGRIHAQLGAALFLSASANLRGLLTTSPEMAGATFDAKLMPPPARTREIADLLRETIRKGGGLAVASDAGLLMGYVGHVSRDPELCKEGLDAFAANIEPDNVADKTFQELLRGVWLGEPVK